MVLSSAPITKIKAVITVDNQTCKNTHTRTYIFTRTHRVDVRKYIIIRDGNDIMLMQGATSGEGDV